MLAIASAMLVGMVCVRKPFRLMPPTARPVSVASSGIARFSPLPGCSRETTNRPTRIDNIEELINQIIALPPTRPMVDVSPRRIIPTVRVLNTKGAITILIRRKKMSVRSVMLSAQAVTTPGEA